MLGYAAYVVFLVCLVVWLTGIWKLSDAWLLRKPPFQFYKYVPDADEASLYYEMDIEDCNLLVRFTAGLTVVFYVWHVPSDSIYCIVGRQRKAMKVTYEGMISLMIEYMGKRRVDKIVKERGLNYRGN